MVEQDKIPMLHQKYLESHYYLAFVRERDQVLAGERQRSRASSYMTSAPAVGVAAPSTYGAVGRRVKVLDDQRVK